MAQDVVAYLIVASAAGWLVWSMFLPRQLKADLQARLRRRRD